MKTEQNEKRSKKERIIILLLLLITLVSIIVSLWVVFLRDTTPQYNIPTPDVNIEKIEGDDGQKLDAPEGGGAVSITYSNKVDISLEDTTAKFMLKNPSESTHDIRVRLVINDNIIYESGMIPAGYSITSAEDINVDGLEAGTYTGKFVIMNYDAKNGEKAIINTEIEELQITIS